MLDIKYSIITPVYNREDCIARCVESVIQQSKNIHYEHIIVNDGSSDHTLDIIQDYSHRYDPYIRVINFSKNRGVNAARNAAIQSMQREYGIILDSNDYFVDTDLADINEYHIKYPQYKHYMFSPDDCVDYYGTNKLLGNTKNGQIKELQYTDFLLNKISGEFIHVVHKQILQMYPFNESLRIYEGLFFLRFYREEKVMLFCNRVVTIRERSRADSVSRDFLKTSLAVVQRSRLCKELKLE